MSARQEAFVYGSVDTLKMGGAYADNFGYIHLCDWLNICDFEATYFDWMDSKANSLLTVAIGQSNSTKLAK